MPRVSEYLEAKAALPPAVAVVLIASNNASESAHLIIRRVPDHDLVR